MSTLFDSSTKPTLNIALKRLAFYGIALGLVSQIMSVVISFLTGSGRLSYESLTTGLGLALGSSIALLLDGKVNNRIRIAIAVVFSIAAMVGLTYGASTLFHS
jgi:hypothetical protein